MEASLDAQAPKATLPPTTRTSAARPSSGAVRWSPRPSMERSPGTRTSGSCHPRRSMGRFGPQARAPEALARTLGRHGEPPLLVGRLEGAPVQILPGMSPLLQDAVAGEAERQTHEDGQRPSERRAPQDGWKSSCSPSKRSEAPTTGAPGQRDLRDARGTTHGGGSMRRAVGVLGLGAVVTVGVRESSSRPGAGIATINQGWPGSATDAGAARSARRNLAQVGRWKLPGEAGGCNDCHTCPSYAEGHDRFSKGDGAITAENSLAGGTAFGPHAEPGCAPPRVS